MEDELHIPWTNDALEQLIRTIIDTGEAPKVDFKSAFQIGTSGEKAELAKDIQAFANSYESAYQNHGFIVLGAAPGKLLCTAFAQDADKMQATVDQIVREHLGPFVPTHVRQFGAGKDIWGVIVVPPSRNAPHVFIRDTATLKRGDICVRVGTTTAKADPADFSRFYRVHLEDHTREIRDQLRDIQRDVAALKKSKPHRAKSAVGATVVDAVAPPAPPSIEVAPTDLLAHVARSLAKASDPVASGLQKETESIRSYLDSKAIPWDLNNITKEVGRSVLEGINEKSTVFWEALARILENDDSGAHDNAVIEALAQLAFDPEPPAGTGFTDLGTGIRLYPLVMALYIIFVVGTRKKRTSLLKRVMDLKLSRRSDYEEPMPLGNALFYVRRADAVFQSDRDDYPTKKWCEAVGSYVDRWLRANLYGAVPTLERNPRFFHIGEFVLSLIAAATPTIARPAPGLFFFHRESQPVIDRFLRAESDQMTALFGGNLKGALESFDKWGGAIATHSLCWGNGFQGGSVDIVFPQGRS